MMIIGSGKLATTVLEALKSVPEWTVGSWDDGTRDVAAPKIVIHAGSGRQLEEVFAYCEATNSVLLELSTGTVTSERDLPFPVIACSNVSILLVKFMYLLSEHGHLFHAYSIEIEESHQATKSSLPGTAVDMANSLGLDPSRILSYRDPGTQQADLGIPAKDLGKHAYHRIRIQDGSASLAFETKVLGHGAYAEGVVAILRAIQDRDLETRRYEVVDLVRLGWI
jgi:4-hydroxy-tetrahydrodipicolinate reductase